MSSKITKKRLSLCKDKSEKLCGIFNEKKSQQVDVTEFVSTVKFVSCVLDEFIKTKDKERLVSQKLFDFLKESLCELYKSHFFKGQPYRTKVPKLNRSFVNTTKLSVLCWILEDS
jgi:hypothetical protein